MKIKKIEKKEFEKLIKQFSNRFALIESEIIQDLTHEDNIDSSYFMPKAEKIEVILEKEDKLAFPVRIWKGTKLENFIEYSPVLASISKDSKIIDKFLSDWGDWNGGVFIDTGEFDEEEVLAHLRSILIVYLKSSQFQFRLQEPRKLFSVLNSLDEYRQVELLGPIKTIVWQENYGVDENYYYLENNNPNYSKNKFGWFTFTNEEFEKISIAEKDWEKRSLLSHSFYEVRENQVKSDYLNKFFAGNVELLLEDNYEKALSYQITKPLNIISFIFNNFYYLDELNKDSVINMLSSDLIAEDEKIQNLINLTNKEGV